MSRFGLPLLRAIAAAGLLLMPGLALTVGTEPTPLRVSVAVSVQPAIEDASRMYSTEFPNVEIALNAGASGALLQQARRGAPADALISASPAEIDRLVADGLALAETRTRIASNSLVIVVPRSAEPPASIEELAVKRFGNVVVANPRTAPLGRYTKQALEASGLWARLEPRLVLAENARHAIDYVARGEVDGGVVYATDARSFQERVRQGPMIPAHLHGAIAYEGVVLAGSSQPRAAAALLDWLASEDGRESLTRRGFLPP